MNTNAKDIRQAKNFATLRNPQFVQACERVGIAPTKRQASKWNNKKGLAWKEGRV